MMNVPIVLIVFNRADTTRKVIDALRLVQPSRLFVVADGPRAERVGEVEKCLAVREEIARIDWDCDLSTDYAEKNMGLRRRVVSGLNRVFAVTDQAIILEDDCIPDSTFFPYCAELLERYAADERVMGISGNNFQFGKKRTSYSYYFSLFTHCWGWATWKRAWQHYDDAMTLWPELRDGGWLNDILGGNKTQVRYWRKIFQNTYDNRYDSWAYRFLFSSWTRNGSGILPNVNLVSNIGMGQNATHTKSIKTDPFANLSIESMRFPLQHPSYLIRDRQSDNLTHSSYYTPPLSERLKRSLIYRLEKITSK